jgi:hypothetical protein
MIPGSANPLLLATAAAGGYSISRSVRFNSSDSAYLSRTPASAGNRKTWTWAGWVKRSEVSGSHVLFGAFPSSGNYSLIQVLSTNQIRVLNIAGGNVAANRVTLRRLRDPSAWFHLVVSSDSSSFLKLYFNGEEQTALDVSVGPDSSDWSFNSASEHTIGQSSVAGGSYLNGLLADIHFCDGTAYDASAFGEFDANGIWQPKKFAGVYGTNGFKLNFSDNSTTTALGTDTSGNGNTWTVNNLSVTAGAGNDSLTDSPTSYGTGSSGGDVRGNFCTWNPLAKLGDITQNLNVSNGNLTFSGSSNIGTIGTIGMSSGKWYWELNCTSLTASQLYFGMTSVTTGSRTASFVGIRDTGVLSGSANGATTNGSGTTAFTTGDVVGFAYDADNKRLFVAKNNTWLNSADPAAGTNASFTDVQGSSLYPFISDNNTTATIDANWGARPFAYTAPSGFKALCTANLPAPTITQPSTVMDVKLYTGTGSSQNITGLGFSPDLVWIKGRSVGYDPRIADAVRGAGKEIFSNNTAAEETNAANGYLSAFNSDGFTLQSGIGVNQSSATYAAWCWDAGSSTVTNTQGSISSQVRANASAGFSIVTYTGTGSTASVGHGLNALPQMIIVKRRDSTSNWAVYHRTLGANTYLFLNSTAASAAISNYWQYTPSPGNPTSDWFGIIGGNDVNVSSATYVAYCFAAVAGYSSMGSFTTSSASTDGVFVYTNHRPRWVLIKETSATGPWIIYDAVRNTYNAANNELRPNTSEAENGGAYLGQIDILSNGFKIRSNSSAYVGEAGDFIYCSFAESPFAANNRAR